MDFTNSTALSRKANLIIISAILIWAFPLYGNTVLNKFTIDDNLVTNNDLVRQGFKAIPSIFSSDLIEVDNTAGGQNMGYMPVAKATYASEYGLWGERPGISHLVNLLLYFIASLITFYVLRRLLISYNILFPVLIILLFMAHPVHTEVVASLKNRDEIIAYLFGMAGMYTLISYCNTRRISFVFLSCALFFLACITKLSALPFIGLYVLVLYFFSNLKARTIITVTILIILTAVIAFVTPWLFVPHPVHTGFYFENALYTEKNLWLRLGTAMLSLLFYIRILFFPYPLLYYYGYNMIPLTSLANPLALLSVFLYAVMLIYCLTSIRRKSFLSFAILWYLTGIYMYSNLLFPVAGIVAERFVFLSSLGFIMAIVFLIFRLTRTEPNSLTIEFESRFKIITLVGIILIPLMFLTLNRNAAWKDEMSLFSRDIPHLKKSAKANYQYAAFLISEWNDERKAEKYDASGQDLREIIKKHLHLSLQVCPAGYNTLNDLGTVFLSIERQYDSALFYFQKTVAVDPSLTPGWFNMGSAYRQLGKYPRALDCYQKFWTWNPHRPRLTLPLPNFTTTLAMSISPCIITTSGENLPEKNKITFFESKDLPHRHPDLF
ncbi:MAG: hypothetical protein D4R97_06895 [Bacteroidetes bacterium]|nr:MAG: hypothetical protein D4R97_06895 [Bacteroidota bacterium]